MYKLMLNEFSNISNEKFKVIYARGDNLKRVPT
jgi:hypothetical protein